jgi:GDPmannose 4,6-dehydratase
MLQQPKADDYVIASGETHSVREFCERAFAILELDYQDFVVSDEHFYRPAEVDELVGDASKARRVLGWEPRFSFQDLIEEMVQHDFEAAKRSQGAESVGP